MRRESHDLQHNATNIVGLRSDRYHERLPDAAGSVQDARRRGMRQAARRPCCRTCSARRTDESWNRL